MVYDKANTCLIKWQPFRKHFFYRKQDKSKSKKLMAWMFPSSYCHDQSSKKVLVHAIRRNDVNYLQFVPFSFTLASQSARDKEIKSGGTFGWIPGDKHDNIASFTPIHWFIPQNAFGNCLFGIAREWTIQSCFKVPIFSSKALLESIEKC